QYYNIYLIVLPKSSKPTGELGIKVPEFTQGITAEPDKEKVELISGLLHDLRYPTRRYWYAYILIHVDCVNSY
ncbi:hypothetical protein ACJX0J_006828, partial [Zea mays]